MSVRTTPETVYVLYCDDHGLSGYFQSAAMGFWLCGKRSDAREFRLRREAAKVLRDNGKARHGWRVLAVTPEPVR